MTYRVFVCLAVLLAGNAAFAQKTDASRGAAKAAVCAGCHGSPKASPLAGLPVLGGQQAEFLVMQMFLMREGLRDVPEMKGLLNGWSDADLNDVAAFFAAQALPADNAKRDLKLHARGAALSQGMGCGSCHMQNYVGQRQVPRIANQREDYLATSMKAFRDNRRTGIDTNMNGIMYQVSDSDIQALAHYFAHQN
jgi:cytochrome c553